MDFKKSAIEVCDNIVTASGGPLLTKADAVKFVEQYLREVYDRGRLDYHNQLADNMYPRNYKS